jgi:hypothetical protein
LKLDYPRNTDWWRGIQHSMVHKEREERERGKEKSVFSPPTKKSTTTTSGEGGESEVLR